MRGAIAVGWSFRTNLTPPPRARPRAAAPRARSSVPELQAGAALLDARHLPPLVADHAGGALHQVAVRARHGPVGQVEVVLQADAHVAPQGAGRGHEPPL